MLLRCFWSAFSEHMNVLRIYNVMLTSVLRKLSLGCLLQCVAEAPDHHVKCESWASST